MKSKIEIDRILYPKNCYRTQAGDFAIFTAFVLDHNEGEEPLIHPTYKTITLKGTVPSISKGDVFIASYGEPETTTYGTSYKLNILTKEIDRTNKKQVREYLKILCGAKIADELMLLESPLELIENREDEELLKVKGIGEKKLESIYKGLTEMSDFSVAYTELLPFGLTKNLINRICRAYGSPHVAIELCKTNPYALAKRVKGVSFLVADNIALKCGLDMNSKERIECAITYILEQHGENGRTYLTLNQLVGELNGLAQTDWSIVEEVLRKMEKEDILLILNEGTEISLIKYFDLEKKIAIELKRLTTAKSEIEVPSDWRERVSDLEDRQGWKHTEEQINGIGTVLRNNVTVVTGYGGTGKSTIVNSMCEVLDGYDIAQTCLSARASLRLSEVTGRQACTIHRLLGLRGVINNVDELNITPLFADILIIDESSMINGTLFLLLLRAVKSGKKVIILGDNGQLQAIGDCAVFSDLLKSNKIPVVRLTQIHRQAQKSAIITKSIDARNQKDLYPIGYLGHSIHGELKDLEMLIREDNSTLIEDTMNAFRQELQKNNGDVMEVQIITALKTRGDVCTKKLNQYIQSIYNPINGRDYFETKEGLRISKGDKVINLKNNYKAKRVDLSTCLITNGSIGIVLEIKDDSLIIDFGTDKVELSKEERNSLSLGYAITIHSSQGSQWLSTICVFDMSAWIMLNVEILYTALSRARKHSILIAEDRAIKQALKTVEEKTKQTYLDRFIMNM